MRSLLVLVSVLVSVAGATASTARPASQACTAGATRTAWVAFLNAFNHGDYQRLDKLFARAPEFGWYSSNAPGLRNLTPSKNRATLISYFRARHAHHDRMQLLAFAYHDDGNFTYRLRRSASDYKSGAWFKLIGKGAVTCTDADTRLIVVSVGGPGTG
jgi:hypothetical protein